MISLDLLKARAPFDRDRIKAQVTEGATYNKDWGRYNFVEV